MEKGHILRKGYVPFLNHPASGPDRFAGERRDLFLAVNITFLRG